MLPSKSKNGSKPVSKSASKPASKPAGSKSEILRVLAVGPGVVQNLASIGAAFEALTGVSLEPGASPTPEEWNAYLLMQQAVLAVVDPSPEQADWVEQALAPFRQGQSAGAAADGLRRAIREGRVRRGPPPDAARPPRPASGEPAMRPGR
jgi:hypothetical protein